MIVNFNGTDYECEKAIKGNDFVHLLDTENKIIAAFEGVSDFSCFTITDGTWTLCNTEDDCYLAIIRDDGTVIKSSKTCEHIPSGRCEFYFTATDGSTEILEVAVFE